ncbi:MULTISPECIES: hypothetical protein [Calothrix]|uniref:Uncharacterized protein n=2 Tax=Calothrix TaxID=1186 RepID=A0ABR8AG93_9CYAN|nr:MULTISPECIES: hypothetical protein [Calothrix]MBD2198323.1 hypothetical protein [Calothrix parietina FACHB-288]MBD2226648.1 hypothetical protein [Calothrix anomala FACHB-343]
MSKFKLYTLISAICMVSVVFYSFIGFSASPAPGVRLVNPAPASKVLPFEAASSTPQSPVKLVLRAEDATGKALENAKFNLEIFNPPHNPWFTTDFPIVEGTKLLDLETIAPKGELEVQQMLPIRGNYQLKVNVTPVVANAFTPIQQTLTLPVAENSVKYRNFAILAVILLLVGLGGGWVIGGRQAIAPGEIAPARVRLLLSGLTVVAIAALLFVNISAEVAQSQGAGHSHSHEHQEHHEHQGHHEHGSTTALQVDNSGIVRQQGLQLQLLGSTNTSVGETAALQLKVTDEKTNQPIPDLLLNITTVMVEDGFVNFAYKTVTDSTGQFSWEQGFFDGAPHKLQVEIAPQPNAERQFKPFQLEKLIDVEGVAPPFSVRFISLAYMTAFVIVGLLIGLQLKRNLPVQS